MTEIQQIFYTLDLPLTSHPEESVCLFLLDLPLQDHLLKGECVSFDCESESSLAGLWLCFDFSGLLRASLGQG